MKAHPSAALLHVRLKRSALCGFFGAGVQKHHYLIRSKKVCIEIVPIGRGVEAEVIFRRDFRKPSLGFMDKADMRLILFAGIERDHSKRWLVVMGAKGCTAPDEPCVAQSLESSHGDDSTHAQRSPYGPLGMLRPE